MWLTEVKLESESLVLLPLQIEHADELLEAASDGQLWDLWVTFVPDQATVHSYIDKALQDQAAGSALPFAVWHKKEGRVIGTTRFCNADSNNKRVEIGYTWYAKSHQRSSVNTECKNLLLTHAFEQLDAIAVEFRTHWHNHASRNAIARLGAKQDGVLRNHQRMADGSYRDTVVFSIIDSEWPTVRTALAYKLSQPRG